MNRTTTTTRRRRDVPAEYWLYFIPILLTALPASLYQWLLALARSDTSQANPSPIRRAISTARCITPEIFSA